MTFLNVYTIDISKCIHDQELLELQKIWGQRGYFKGKYVVLIFLSETSFCFLCEMDTGLGGPGQTKDDSYGFDSIWNEVTP